MKKLILGMMALTLTFSVMAQADKKKDRKEGHKKEHFSGKHRGAELKNLNLTPEQRTKVQSLNENFKTQLKELNSKGDITVQEQKERRASLMKEHKENLAAILTPEQKDQLKKQKKEGPAKEINARGDRFTEIDKQLDLTDQQGQRIKAINQNFRTQHQEVSKNTALTKEEKRTQLSALQKRHTEEIKSVLTQEQKEKLETLKKNRSGRKAVK